MDLVAGVRRVVVVMEHSAKGQSKVVKHCTLPITGQACVDLLITDLCVMEMDRVSKSFVLKELAPGVTLEDVRAHTAAEFEVSPSISQVQVRVPAK